MCFLIITFELCRKLIQEFLLQVDEIRGSDECVSAIKFSGNRRFLAIGYMDGTVRLYDRKGDGLKSFILMLF